MGWICLVSTRLGLRLGGYLDRTGCCGAGAGLVAEAGNAMEPDSSFQC